MAEFFFTGCTHLGHANIIQLANRPFASVEEMDEHMVDQWNKRVGPKDFVFHLGDFTFHREPDKLQALTNRLNGIKTLVLGNHDKEELFRACRGWPVIMPYFKTPIMFNKVALFHYPIEEWDGFFKGHLHVHAHTHSHDKKGARPVPNRVNVSVEAWGYTPASWDEVLEVWA